MSNFFDKSNKRKGFTLIELLVVISIISLLSTVILTAVMQAKSKARDQYRITSFKQVANALELFYSTNGRYPISNGSSSCNGGGNWISDSGNVNWSNGLLSKQPHDPIEASSACPDPYDITNTPLSPSGYWYASYTGQDYILVAKLENNSSYDIQSTGALWIQSPYQTLYPASNWYPYDYVQKNKTP